MPEFHRKSAGLYFGLLKDAVAILRAVAAEAAFRPAPERLGRLASKDDYASMDSSADLRYSVLCCGLNVIFSL
jgi:hypothetical protein